MRGSSTLGPMLEQRTEGRTYRDRQQETVPTKRSPMGTMVRGAAAGAAATVPMTAFIEALNRSVPRHRRTHLPPRQIAEEMTQRTDVGDLAGEGALDVATMAAHLGFGGAMGALYATVAPRVPLPPVVTGIGFGLAVWTSNYAGFLPALELQRPPDERSAGRNWTMIAGHVVWGAALGWAEARLR
jgi:uncharacterized membrane protein YagU involved in acid resistance